MLHMEYDDIITRLRTVYQAGQPIRLVIARTVSVETSTGEVPDINDVSAKCSKICTSHNAFFNFHQHYAIKCHGTLTIAVHVHC